MPSIFKKALGLVVEFDEKEPEQSTVKTAATKLTTPQTDSPSSFAPQPIPPAEVPHESSASLQQAMEHFDKVLEDENTRNHPGNDYYEFVLTKDAMSEIPIEQRYKASFVGMKVSGMTKDKLLSTADDYIKAIDTELNSFNDQFKITYSLQVDKKRELIKSKSDQIQKLSEQINAITEELKQLNQDVLTSKSKLELAKTTFETAGETQKQKIQQEKQNINQYIV